MTKTPLLSIEPFAVKRFLKKSGMFRSCHRFLTVKPRLDIF